MKNGRPTLILILFLLLLAACQEKEEPIAATTFTPSPTIRPSATFTPAPATTQPPTTTSQPETAEPTNTSSSTAEPTIDFQATPIPTETPLPTSTQTPFPDILLTPATPPAATNYQLKPWTPTEADNLARLMESYFDSMGQNFTSTAAQIIYHGYAEYAANTYEEALVRYPESQFVTHWQLGEAAYRAISNDPDNADHILEIILQPLNDRKVNPTVTELNNWLNNSPIEFWITGQSIKPPDGYTGSYIFAIGIDGYAIGGTTIWILENESGYIGKILHSNLGQTNEYFYDLNFGSLTQSEDVTVIISTSFYRTGASLSDHIIYNLNESEPVKLEFGQIPWLFVTSNSLNLETDADGQDHMLLESMQRNFCKLDLSESFVWNGRWFEVESVWARFFTSQTADACLYFWLSSSSFSRLSSEERSVILADFEDEFGEFEPQESEWFGEYFGADTSDYVRLILALNHAVLGNVEQVRDYLQRIVDTPAVEDSRWIEPASLFLGQYETAEDLYPACLQAVPDICPLDDAFIQSVASLPPMDWGTLQNQILEWGTLIEAGSNFDFDGDGTNEHWLLMRHRREDLLQLWIFAEWDDGWQALSLGDNASLPPNYQIETIDPSNLTRPITFDHTLFSTSNGQLYAFFRHPTSDQPFVRPMALIPEPETDPITAEFNAILDRLFAGENTAEIVTDLLALAEDPAFQPTARYYYHLGLAYELSSDEPNAVNAYLTAWQDHCCDEWEFPQPFTAANPYAIMAQAKLIPN